MNNTVMLIAVVGFGYLLTQRRPVVAAAPMPYAPTITPSQPTPGPAPAQGNDWAGLATAGVGLITGIVNAATQPRPSSGSSYGNYYADDGLTDYSDQF